MVENRRVGIKSRETYECPAALALIMAHKDLESICLERDLDREKARLEPRYAELIYDGLWFSPLKQALDAFVDSSQEFVTGEVRLHLEPGRCDVTGRRSAAQPLRLRASPPTTPPTRFRHEDSAGFVRLWGLGIETWAARQGAERIQDDDRRRQPRAGPSGTAASTAARPTSCWPSPSACPFDRRLAADDIAGSRAHVRGLVRAGILDGDEAGAVLGRPRPGRGGAGRRHVRLRARRRGHPHRGRAAGHRAGRPGRRQAPHRPQPQRPGRHRPAALHQAGAGRGGRAGCSTSRQALLDRADEAGDAYLPGYTHLQRAQPVLLAHHLLAHGWALARDVDRLLATRDRADVSPLGAGALAGSSLPLDPAGIAADLGFAAAFDNSLDAVSDRDFVAEALFDLALLGVHLSRIGEEVVLWSSEEFGFLAPRRRLRHRQLDAAAEEEPRHRRAGPGQDRPARSATSPACSTTLKGLPLAYNRDLQEDKEPLFDAVDQVSPGPRRARRACSPPPTFDTDRMAAAADAPDAAATDLAEHLVERGTPFRDAHAVVGALVRDARSTTSVPLADLVAAHAALGPEAAALLEPGVSVTRRTTRGGAGPGAGRRPAGPLPGPPGRRPGSPSPMPDGPRRRALAVPRSGSRSATSEVDMQQVVFNAHYLTYCDDAIAGWMRAPSAGPALDDHDRLDARARPRVEWQGSATYGDDARHRLRRRAAGARRRSTSRFGGTVDGAPGVHGRRSPTSASCRAPRTRWSCPSACAGAAALGSAPPADGIPPTTSAVTDVMEQDLTSIRRRGPADAPRFGAMASDLPPPPPPVPDGGSARPQTRSANRRPEVDTAPRRPAPRPRLLRRAQPAAIVRAVHATKVYGSGDTEVRALDDVSVEFAAGSLHGDHGPVGLGQVDADALPGRARHADAAATSSSATSTSATLSDKELTIMRRERIGFVFQSFNLIPTLTALENITLPIDLAGAKPDPGVDRRRDRHGRSAQPLEAPAVRALRRPAAARRRGPGARQPTRGDLRRRAHRQPRLPGRHRDPRLHAAGRRRARPDDRDGHPRPAGRRLRAGGALPRRRPHRRPHGRPDAAPGARPPQGLRGLTPVWRRHLQVDLGPQAPPDRHLPGGHPRRRLPHRHPGARATRSARRSATCSPRSTTAPTPSSAARRKVEAGGDTQRAYIPETLVEEVRAVDGVAVAEPALRGQRPARRQGRRHDRRLGPPTFAGNWIDNETLNPYQLAEGRAPRRGQRGGHRPGLGRRRRPRASGTRTTVLMPAADSRCGSSASPRSASSTTPVGTTETDFIAAEPRSATWSAAGRRSATCWCAADEGVSQEELVQRLDRALPSSVESITGEELTDEQQDEIGEAFLDFFTTFLLVFAAIALIVATFSIYNTFTILVAQRTRESALLRAVGASRRQILQSVLAETFLIGLVSSVIGFFVGLGVAAGLKAAFNALGAEVPTGSLAVKPATVITALVVGVLVTVRRGVPRPYVRHACRPSPPCATSPSRAPARRSSAWPSARCLTVIGLGLVLYTAFGGDGDAPARTGRARRVPAARRRHRPRSGGRPTGGPILGAPVARFRGVTGRLARENAMRNPRRTAGTASALLFFITVVTLFTVFFASVKESIAPASTRASAATS